METLAERGERNRRFALKKRAAKLSLKRDHGIGQGGLGHAAAAGCPREAALFAERQEVANLVHLHGPNPRIGGAETAIDVGLEVRGSSHIGDFRRTGLGELTRMLEEAVRAIVAATASERARA